MGALGLLSESFGGAASSAQKQTLALIWMPIHERGLWCRAGLSGGGAVPGRWVRGWRGGGRRGQPQRRHRRRFADALAQPAQQIQRECPDASLEHNVQSSANTRTPSLACKLPSVGQRSPQRGMESTTDGPVHFGPCTRAKYSRIQLQLECGFHFI